MKKMLALVLAIVLVLAASYLVKHVICNDNCDDTATTAPTTMTCPENEPTNESAEVSESTEATLPTEVETIQLFECEYDTSRYYYNQLSEPEKEIYHRIGESKHKFINNEKVCIASNEYMNEELKAMAERALLAYLLDNPISSIWLSDTNVQFGWDLEVTENDYTMKDKGYFVTPYGYQVYHKDPPKFVENSPEEIDRMIAEVESVTREFVQTLEGTDEERMKQIHDWLVTDSEYSVETPYVRDVYGAIIQKVSCCAGDAYAFKYVADMAGLNVISVVGIGVKEGESLQQIKLELEAEGLSSEANHAWNYAFSVYTGWSLVDCTWDRVIHLTPTDEYKDYYTEDGEYLGTFPVNEESVIAGTTWLFVDLESEKNIQSHVASVEKGFKYPG